MIQYPDWLIIRTFAYPFMQSSANRVFVARRAIFVLYYMNSLSRYTIRTDLNLYFTYSLIHTSEVRISHLTFVLGILGPQCFWDYLLLIHKTKYSFLFQTCLWPLRWEFSSLEDDWEASRLLATDWPKEASTIINKSDWTECVADQTMIITKYILS